ncbi:MAG: ribonuclease III [Eubacterium sp.]|jgi:Uncharacterized protein conserved in bacteria|nr:ribonuclease III [Eubacterium sp.]
MEKGINQYIKEQFGLKDIDLRTYSPLTFAYIGDEIYDLIVRSVVVGKGNTRPSKLHAVTSRFVKAAAQASMMEAIEPLLSEEEADIYRRGRNAKSATMAKNATMSDYRKATGFEALMGYLYLDDRFDRVVELSRIGMQYYEESGKQAPENRKKQETASGDCKDQDFCK